MTWKRTLILLPALLLVLSACETSTDRVDSGGVLLSISDFDGLPIRIAVNGAGAIVQVGELTVENIVADPNGVSSSLMNVEIQSYEVTYTRADRGSRVPPPLVNGLLGVAPVNGTFVVENLPLMAAPQFSVPPLSDLLFQNGGFDKETGEDLVRINFAVRFFGRTLSGDAVQTPPANFTVEFVP